MANKPIKKIAICTGFDQEEKPIWDTQPIATQSEYVTLSTIDTTYNFSFNKNNDPENITTVEINSGTKLTTIITTLLEKIKNYQSLLATMYDDIETLKSKIAPEEEESEEP